MFPFPITKGARVASTVIVSIQLKIHVHALHGRAFLFCVCTSKFTGVFPFFSAVLTK